MTALHTFLIVSAAAGGVLWVALALHLMAIERRRVRAHSAIAAAVDILRQQDVRALPLHDRVDRIAAALESASREMVMRGAADYAGDAAIGDALAGYVAKRWGMDVLERDAASHSDARSKWRRGAALRILSQLGHPSRMELLASAVRQRDGDVASVALSLLGRLQDPEAGEVLVEALTSGRHPASRVAAHLEHSPLPLGDRLRPLLRDQDPTVRFWAATLLGRCVDLEGLDRELLPLADDADPRVRKAAIETLGRFGSDLTGAVAVRLLVDPVPFVRAHAVRALGKLDRPEFAADVSALLGDHDWWVRFAAKQTLEAMGTEVWPVLVRCITHADRFVRNGAAEVLQNLGLLDSLIVMEAASDNPAPQKIDMLRRIAAAGGVRLTASLVERAGPVGPRVRGLLAAIGFEEVGAA